MSQQGTNSSVRFTLVPAQCGKSSRTFRCSASAQSCQWSAEACSPANLALVFASLPPVLPQAFFHSHLTSLPPRAIPATLLLQGLGLGSSCAWTHFPSGAHMAQSSTCHELPQITLFETAALPNSSKQCLPCFITFLFSLALTTL